MSKNQFLALAKQKLKPSQYEEVKKQLTNGHLTSLRYLIEDEYDIVAKAATDLISRGETDDVIQQRMSDMQTMYNQFMEHIELEV